MKWLGHLGIVCLATLCGCATSVFEYAEVRTDPMLSASSPDTPDYPGGPGDEAVAVGLREAEEFFALLEAYPSSQSEAADVPEDAENRTLFLVPRGEKWYWVVRFLTELREGRALIVFYPASGSRKSSGGGGMSLPQGAEWNEELVAAWGRMMATAEPTRFSARVDG